MRLSGLSQTSLKTDLPLPPWISQKTGENVQRYLDLRETDPASAKRHLQIALYSGANQVIGALSTRGNYQQSKAALSDMEEAVKNMPLYRRWIFYIRDFIESRT